MRSDSFSPMSVGGKNHKVPITECFYTRSEIEQEQLSFVLQEVIGVYKYICTYLVVDKITILIHYCCHCFL